MTETTLPIGTAKNTEIRLPPALSLKGYLLMIGGTAAFLILPQATSGEINSRRLQLTGGGSFSPPKRLYLIMASL